MLQVQPSSHPAFKVLVTRLTVAPQSTGIVDITLDSAVSPGALHGSVNIAFEGLQAEVKASLTAQLQDLAVKFDRNLLEFGKVALETERTRKVAVCNLTGVPITLKAQVQNSSHPAVFNVEPALVVLPPYDEVIPTACLSGFLHAACDIVAETPLSIILRHQFHHQFQPLQICVLATYVAVHFVTASRKTEGCGHSTV